MSTEGNLITNLTIGEKLGKSDHSIVRFHINLSYQATKKTIQKLDFRRADFNQLKEKVRNLNYVHNGNFDNIWTSFIDAYRETRTTCIPYRQTSSNGTLQPKWFNREIANKIKERNRIHKLLTAHNTPERTTTHRKLCREVDKLVRIAKSDEEKRVALASKENPKEFYSYVNSREPIKNKIGPLKDEDDVLIIND